MNEHIKQFEDHGLGEKLQQKSAIVGIIGLGYVGLPLAIACARGGFATIGFDVDPGKIQDLNSGRSYIDAVPAGELGSHVEAKRFRATADFAELVDCDVIVICVPTPLTRYREPDLHYVTATAETIARRLRQGQLVVLESTTFPGTTEEIVKPILEQDGLTSGSDFFLGFSPEREDPGNATYRTVTIPKVVAGDGTVASTLVQAFYGSVVERVVAVSSTSVAEAVKITENVFRAVNIALVNELKVIYDNMGIDVWEVIDAASTKPFGYMPFYPGPGLGGHCIPIDPFYLTWKAREYGLSTRFIELAGEINVSMPKYVISKLENALDSTQKTSLGSARVLVLGLAYKKNVSDIRESPSFTLMDLLENRGVHVDYHDPHVQVIPPTREHSKFQGRHSVELTPESIAGYHAVLIVTDHEAVNYRLISEHAKLVVDTRNVMEKQGLSTSNVIKS